MKNNLETNKRYERNYYHNYPPQAQIILSALRRFRSRSGQKLRKAERNLEAGNGTALDRALYNLRIVQSSGRIDDINTIITIIEPLIEPED